MNLHFLISRTLPILALAAVLVTGCRREEEDTDTNAASDNALAEATFSDVANITDEAGRTGDLTNYRVGDLEGTLSACATITFDSLISTDNDTLVIDFGTTNCTGSDGRNRRGKVVVIYNGRFRDVGHTHTVTFDNYFVNDNQVLGTKTVTNLGPNAAGHTVYDIDVNGQIVLANGGGTITWTSQRQREWVAGENTAIWSDDLYSITGSASGTSASGNSYTMNITSPLIRNMALGCRRHFTQGTFQLTPANRPMRTVDFGSGACDNVATVTINNNTYTIQLR